MPRGREGRGFGELILRQGKGVPHDRQDGRRRPAPALPLQPAHATQRLLVRGLAAGDRQRALVGQHAAAGDVPAPRLPLPPCDQGAEHRQAATVQGRPPLDATVLQPGIRLIGGGRGQRGDFGFDPGEAPFPSQPFDHPVVQRGEIPDVVQGIGELRRGEGPGGPVGVGVPLLHFDSQELMDHRRVRRLGGKPEERGGDLRVEDRRGDPAGPLVDDLQVLPPGVHQLEDRGVEEQVVERRQIARRRAGPPRRTSSPCRAGSGRGGGSRSAPPRTRCRIRPFRSRASRRPRRETPPGPSRPAPSVPSPFPLFS